MLPQFLDSKDLPGIENIRSNASDGGRPAGGRQVAYHMTQKLRPPAEDTVWVDCFYYGFYMEKSKLPAYQAGLRQQQQHGQGKSVAAAH